MLETNAQIYIVKLHLWHSGNFDVNVTLYYLFWKLPTMQTFLYVCLLHNT